MHDDSSSNGYFLDASLCKETKALLLSLATLHRSLKGVCDSLGVRGIFSPLRTRGKLNKTFCSRPKVLEVAQYSVITYAEKNKADLAINFLRSMCVFPLTAGI